MCLGTPRRSWRVRNDFERDRGQTVFLQYGFHLRRRLGPPVVVSDRQRDLVGADVGQQRLLPSRTGGWADEHDLANSTLPRFTPDCERANGERGSEWPDPVRKEYSPGQRRRRFTSRPVRHRPSTTHPGARRGRSVHRLLRCGYQRARSRRADSTGDTGQEFITFRRLLSLSPHRSRYSPHSSEFASESWEKKEAADS